MVEGAQPLAELKPGGAIGLEVAWQAGQGPAHDTTRAVAALCAAHPGPAPVFVRWSDGNGMTARLRAQRLRVDLDEPLLEDLRQLVGPDRVQLVRAK